MCRKKLQCREAVQLCILGLVNDAHPTLAKFFENAIVRYGLTDHGQLLFVCSDKLLLADNTLRQSLDIAPLFIFSRIRSCDVFHVTVSSCLCEPAPITDNYSPGSADLMNLAASSRNFASETL